MNHFHPRHCHLFKVPRGTSVMFTAVNSLHCGDEFRVLCVLLTLLWQRAKTLAAVQCGEGLQRFSKVGDNMRGRVSPLLSNPRLSTSAWRANRFCGSQSATFLFPLCPRSEGLLERQRGHTWPRVYGDSNVAARKLKWNTNFSINQLIT